MGFLMNKNSIFIGFLYSAVRTDVSALTLFIALIYCFIKFSAIEFLNISSVLALFNYFGIIFLYIVTNSLICGLLPEKISSFFYEIYYSMEKIYDKDINKAEWQYQQNNPKKAFAIQVLISVIYCILWFIPFSLIIKLFCKILIALS